MTDGSARHMAEEIRKDRKFIKLADAMAAGTRPFFGMLVTKNAAQAATALNVLEEAIAAKQAGAPPCVRLSVEKDRAQPHLPVTFEMTMSQIFKPLYDWKKTTDGAAAFVIDASAAQTEDESAWIGFFQHLDSVKDVLFERLSGPLLLVAPKALEIEFAFRAPNLWKICDGVTRLRARVKPSDKPAEAPAPSEEVKPKPVETLDVAALQQKISDARQRYVSDPDSFTAAHALDVLLNRLGDYLVGGRELTEALQVREEALDVLRNLTFRNPSRVEWRHDLAININKVADLHYARKDMEQGLSFYLEARKIMYDLIETEPNRKEWRRDLSVNLNKIGDIYREQNRLPEALKSYEEGLKIRQTLTDMDPDNAQWHLDLSVSWERIGDIHRLGNRPDQALAAYDSSLGIRRRLLAADKDNPQWQRFMTVSLEKSGNMHKDRGEAEQALAAYEESLKLRESLLADDPDNLQLRRDLSVSLSKVGDMHRSLGNLDQALAAYQKDTEITLELVNQDAENPTVRFDLASTYCKLAIVYETTRKNFAAVDYLKKAINELKPLAEKYPDVARWRKTLGFCEKFVAKLLKKIEEYGSEGEK